MTGRRIEAPLVWEDPPQAGFLNWAERLAPLIERPGQWARVQEYSRHGTARTTVTELRQGPRAPAGRWEFASRKIDGRFYVYARYLGPAENGNGSEP